MAISLAEDTEEKFGSESFGETDNFRFGERERQGSAFCLSSFDPEESPSPVELETICVQRVEGHELELAPSSPMATHELTNRLKIHMNRIMHNLLLNEPHNLNFSKI